MLYVVLRAVFRFLYGLLYGLKVTGLEHIPATGPVILCANHISNLDPPIVGIPLERKVHFMAKEELFRVPVIGWAIPRLGAFPVKRGDVSKESIRFSIQLLEEGKVLCIFPEGNRKNAGGMGKKGAAMLALRSQATVIPAAIVGEYKLFRRMRVMYGKPVDLTEFAEGGASQLEEATNKIMAAIRQMVTESKKTGIN